MSAEKKYHKYSTEDLKIALEAIKGGLPCATASKQYGVPRTTLIDKIKGKYPVECKSGVPTILTENEEKILSEWIINMARMGFPISTWQLLDSVAILVNQLQRPNKFHNGRPGRHWYEGFLKRHPEISVRMSQNLCASRAAITESKIRNWFKEIQNYFNSENIDINEPNRIFNADESAFFLSPVGNNVLAKKGSKAVYNRCGNDKDCLTVLITDGVVGITVKKQFEDSGDATSSVGGDSVGASISADGGTFRNVEQGKIISNSYNVHQNPHSLTDIDISGFEFPSGFTFPGSASGSASGVGTSNMQSSHFQNELTPLPPIPYHNSFDTAVIDGSSHDGNTINHDHDHDDNGDDELQHHHHQTHEDTIDDQTMLLHFGTENNTVVTSQTGSTALLPCVVNNIGDGMVSWIRRKDYHLLTVGLTTYNSDERFQAIHLQHSEDWTLQIKFVQKRDAGLYECQVSSHPPQSIFVRLDVVEARAEISGPSEKFLKPGSSLRLQCVVVQCTESPLYVFWYHNNRMINYDLDRGINVTTDLAAKISTLSISSATTKHTGNYTCVPSNAQPASTYVHILNGENPAAMQHGGRGLSWLRCPSAWLLILSVLFSVTLSS